MARPVVDMVLAWLGYGSGSGYGSGMVLANIMVRVVDMVPAAVIMVVW